MQQNTVILSLETYNDLRDFKKEIEDGYICRISGPYGISHTYLGLTDAMDELAEEIKILEKENCDLTKQLDDKSNLKGISWLEFIKIKLGINKLKSKP